MLAAASLGLALARVLPALWMGAAAAGVLAAVGIALLVAAAAKKKGAERARADVLERYGANTPDDILTRANAYRERCVVAAEAARRREAVERSLVELTAQDQETKAKLLALVHTFAPTVTDTFGVSAAISGPEPGPAAGHRQGEAGGGQNPGRQPAPAGARPGGQRGGAPV